MVELKGSEKQIKWASDLRAKLVSRIEKDLEMTKELTEESDDQVELFVIGNQKYQLTYGRKMWFKLCEGNGEAWEFNYTKARVLNRINGFLAFVKNIDASRVWIDARFELLETLLDKYLEVCDEPKLKKDDFKNVVVEEVVEEVKPSAKEVAKKAMKRAWEIAREAVKKFGGKVKEFLSISLKMAWAEVR